MEKKIRENVKAFEARKKLNKKIQHRNRPIIKHII